MLGNWYAKAPRPAHSVVIQVVPHNVKREAEVHCFMQRPLWQGSVNQFDSKDIGENTYLVIY